VKKVLVIGGAGYVGCVLIEELLNKGYSVRVLDRLLFGLAPMEHLLDRVELIHEDMRDLAEPHVEDCMAVINVGGLSNDPTAEFNPRANEELNTFAAIRVAEVAKRVGVPRLIFASTCSIYDRGLGDESRDVVLDEEAPVDPRAAYALSKYAGEQALLRMSDDDFCVTSFRKGTIHGFSPRMRYDLVLNTFVKDALSRGSLSLQRGGEMWRPLIDVRDVARAYVMAIEADAADVGGQIFNLSAGNFRISEVALRTQRALADMGVHAIIEADYSYRTIRNYRVSSEKSRRVLGFQPQVSIEQSILHMVEEIRRWNRTDFANPRYYNIEWIKLLEESAEIVRTHGYVLTKPEHFAAPYGVVALTGERRRDRVG
jgi:nucleoside-diphosphate-sugar epimerase